MITFLHGKLVEALPTQVTVDVESFRSQKVFVMGEVRTPGKYMLTGSVTLVEALAQAGSLTPTCLVAVVRQVTARMCAQIVTGCVTNYERRSCPYASRRTTR